jgi:hypothetical protein
VGVKPLRLAQAKTIKIVTKKEIPVQMVSFKYSFSSLFLTILTF